MITATFEITTELVEAHNNYEKNLSVVVHRSYHPSCGEYTFTGTKDEYDADRKVLDGKRRFMFGCQVDEIIGENDGTNELYWYGDCLCRIIGVCKK